MADPQQNYRSVLARLEAKDKEGTSAQDLYDAASFLPGTGEAIAAYELPGILSQSGKMMQSKDFLEAAGGTALGTLGIASVLPMVGPAAKAARKGLEGFIPYIGPKTAVAGGPDIDASIMKMEGTSSGGGSKAAEKPKLKKDPNEDGSYLLNIDNKEYKVSKFYDDDEVHRGEWSIFERAPATEYTEEGWDWMDTVTSRGYAVERIKEIDAAKQVEAPVKKEPSQVEMDFTSAKAADDIGLGSGSLFAPQSKKGRQLLVLSCSSTKCPDVGDMKAVDRYLGPVFQSLKKQGVPDNVDVAILSAKHGLIRADTNIKDYDQLMDTNRASEFKESPDQMNRIKNTLDGYDKVVVQGGKNYKDVIRAASGDANVTEIAGGRGIGDQRRSVKSALAFSKIDTPVYHFSQNIDPGFTKFDPDKAPAALDGLGIHVGSTPKAAEDRFMDLTFGFGGRETRRSIAKEKGIDYDVALSYMELPAVSGNVGYQKVGSGQFSLPIPRKSLGGSIPLKADLSKPYLPEGNYKYSQDSKQWQESEITDHLLDKYNDDRGKTFTMQHLVGDKPNFPFGDFRKFIGEFRKDLAKDGFTHLPYYNDVEDVASTSYIMLTDRPKGSTKVLQSPSAAKDPDKFDDPDFMMQEGGVVSLKDRAVNMTRRPQGIEPFIKFVV